MLRWKSIAYGIGVSIAIALVLISLNKSVASRLYLGNTINVEEPEYLRATWWRNRETGEYIEKCHVEKEYQRSLLNECLKRNQAEKQALFLIGDSHARNYLKAAHEAFPSSQAAYLTMGYGCAFLPSSLIDSDVENKTNCSNYVKDVTEYLSQSVRKGDIVFIGQLLMSPGRENPEYFNFIGELAAILSTREIPIILLDGTAPPLTNHSSVFQTPWRPSRNFPGCSISLTEVKQRYLTFDRMAEAFSDRHKNVFYTPLRDGLCVEDSCGQTTSNETPIWHDFNGHITEKSSAELAPLLIERLQKDGFSQQFHWVTITEEFDGL